MDSNKKIIIKPKFKSPNIETDIIKNVFNQMQSDFISEIYFEIEKNNSIGDIFVEAQEKMHNKNLTSKKVRNHNYE